jgi:hypothetical protein
MPGPNLSRLRAVATAAMTIRINAIAVEAFVLNEFICCPVHDARQPNRTAPHAEGKYQPERQKDCISTVRMN